MIGLSFAIFSTIVQFASEQAIAHGNYSVPWIVANRTLPARATSTPPSMLDHAEENIGNQSPSPEKLNDPIKLQNNTPSKIKLIDEIGGFIRSLDRPDTIFINRTYNATQIDSSYHSGGDAIHPYIGYGTAQKASGSVALIGGNINIFNSSNGKVGRSEFTPISVGVVPIKGGSFEPGSNYYNDFNVQSAYSGKDQEGFLASASFAVQKWSIGNRVDKNHAGSYGISVTSVPRNIGYDAQDHRAERTYPLNAMISLSGWSGPQADTEAGGQTPQATPAAQVGIKIGGLGGSVWSCASCQSYIPIGIDINDYTDAAIRVGSPNRQHAKAAVAIKLEPGAGNLVVGDNITAGTSERGGAIEAPHLRANSISKNNSPTISLAYNGTDKWTITSDKNGRFSITNTTRSTSLLSAEESGMLTIGEGHGVKFTPSVFSNLPTCSINMQGTIAFITDAVEKIESWRQVIRHGGGIYKAFISCDGTEWRAFS